MRGYKGPEMEKQKRKMDKRLLPVLFLLLACGITLSLAASVFAFFPFDLAITRDLQEEENPVFAAVMKGISALGDGWMPLILAGAVTAIFVLRRRRLEAVFVVATLSSVLLASAIKVLVGRPRPPSFFPDPADFFRFINQYSYPSGHVLFFVAFFGFLAFLAWLYLAGWKRLTVIAVCGALIMLIGPSRIYVGAHWASDVIGSYIMGTLLLCILMLGYLLALERRNKRAEARGVG